MQRVGVVALWIVGLYLVARAIAEPFVIDVGDPATYRNDWGGPHLAGMLAVHCVPGIVAAALMIRSALRRRRSSGAERRAQAPGVPPLAGQQVGLLVATVRGDVAAVRDRLAERCWDALALAAQGRVDEGRACRRPRRLRPNYFFTAEPQARRR